MRVSSADKLELVAGVALLIIGWMVSLLMVTYVLPRNIILSMISYAITLFGLFLTLYALASLLVKGRGVKR
ncbi:MAG: hypothetical protein RMH77_00760 [Sulfolobales archaeon]|nr:hypothetical protein [Sulfolobales archaeon]MCX8186338.1 hypothetical protein [Sulfolobales archaeon]MDW7968926.1 hypothetical protein [Sulfolobales archaeon]